MSASISRAKSFHFGGCEGALDELVNFIFIGFVSSMSENILEEDGESTDTAGDFGSCIAA